MYGVKVWACFILVNIERINANVIIHIRLYIRTALENSISGVEAWACFSISLQAAVNHRPEDVNNPFERADWLHLSGQCNSLF